MRRHTTTVRVLSGIALMLLFVLGPAATARAEGGVIQLSGVMVTAPNGVCTELPSVQPAAIVSGSLVGCWYLTTADDLRSGPSGHFYASGTETFVGCAGDLCGRLYTTFTFTAKFAPDGSEIHGRCHHPVVGGDGDFAGASGVINMHDDPDGCVFYKGHITV